MDSPGKPRAQEAAEDQGVLGVDDDEVPEDEGVLVVDDDRTLDEDEDPSREDRPYLRRGLFLDLGPSIFLPQFSGDASELGTTGGFTVRVGHRFLDYLASGASTPGAEGSWLRPTSKLDPYEYVTFGIGLRYAF